MDTAARRLAARHGHFFDPDLLGSQFADLELPQAGEPGVVVAPVRERAADTADEIVRLLGLDRQAGVV